MPHGFCYLWKPEILWLHAISDGLITLSYYVIPVMLIYFVRKRRDLPFDWMFVMFGIFIFGCGTTHLMEIWTLWHGTYRLSGLIKAITAGASLYTAAALFPLIPKALALPSPAALRMEIAERKCAEQLLQEATADLELRVKQRTVDLQKANDSLIAEIEQRKQTEEQLRRSEGRFRLLVDTVQDYAIFSVDPHGAVTSWNAGAEHVYGYTAEQIVGAHFVRFYPQEDAPSDKAETALRNAAAEGRFEEEGFRARKDGLRFWANTVMTALRDSQGRLVGYSKITRDLTERRRAEEAVQAARAELAHASRVSVMGELTSSIAHEVSQPLTSIVMNANACKHALAAEPPEIEEVRQAIDDISEAGTRAGQVISRVRPLVKRSPPENAALNINSLVEEVLTLVQGELKRREIASRIELSPQLATARGDRVQLQQVVLNLVMNAADAMSLVADRARVLHIRSRNRDPRQVSVVFEDSGIGFKAEARDRLFRSFYTTKPGGMGMGLSICKSIVEAHGGKLLATPNAGFGATFEFTLPTE
jgi:PAS domain S-box-containing protein